MKFFVPFPIKFIEPNDGLCAGDAVREIAAAMEHAGIAGTSLSEHPAPSAEWLRSDPAAHDCLDPLVALAFAAGATSDLMLITNILVLPYRNPFLTAKGAATLQLLSDNRLILGVGTGYMEAEFDALGIAFDRRGKLSDEALETIKLAWAGGAVVKQGSNFKAIGNEPRPVPSPPPPIWVGGGSVKALERAAHWGDGWMPHFRNPTNDPVVIRSSLGSMEEFGEKLKRLGEMREKLGRSGPFDAAPCAPIRPQEPTRAEADKFIEVASDLSRCGANWTWTQIPAPSRSAFLENLAWFGENVVAEFNRPDG